MSQQTAGDTPSRIILAPGEQGLRSQRFSPSILLFWLRTEVVVSNRRIIQSRPNTLLGIIPLGYQEVSMPLTQVTGVGVNSQFKLGRALLGVLFILVSFLCWGYNGVLVLGLILVLLGIVLILQSFFASLTIQNAAGGNQDVTVSALERKKLEEFRHVVNEFVYGSHGGAATQAFFQNANAGQVMGNSFTPNNGYGAMPSQYQTNQQPMAPMGYEPSNPQLGSQQSGPQWQPSAQPPSSATAWDPNTQQPAQYQQQQAPYQQQPYQQQSPYQQQGDYQQPTQQQPQAGQERNPWDV